MQQLNKYNMRRNENVLIFEAYVKSLNKESPDNIRVGDGEEDKVYYQANDESYTVLIFKSQPKSFFVYRKDKPMAAGHALLRKHIRAGVTENIISEIPLSDVADNLNRDSFGNYEARIWTEHKVLSFWLENISEDVKPVIPRLFTSINQNPEDYIVELDGETYNSGLENNPNCYTYSDFMAGVKTPIPPEHAAKRNSDKNLMAQAKLGMLKKPVYASPSPYKREGD